MDEVNWHGKMTAKAALRLGYITREQFKEIRKAFKAKHPNGGELHDPQRKLMEDHK
jgi:hypothetical protein